MNVGLHGSGGVEQDHIPESHQDHLFEHQGHIAAQHHFLGAARTADAQLDIPATSAASSFRYLFTSCT